MSSYQVYFLCIIISTTDVLIRSSQLFQQIKCIWEVDKLPDILDKAFIYDPLNCRIHSNSHLDTAALGSWLQDPFWLATLVPLGQPLIPRRLGPPGTEWKETRNRAALGPAVALSAVFSESEQQQLVKTSYGSAMTSAQVASSQAPGLDFPG